MGAAQLGQVISAIMHSLEPQQGPLGVESGQAGAPAARLASNSWDQLCRALAESASGLTGHVQVAGTQAFHRISRAAPNWLAADRSVLRPGAPSTSRDIPRTGACVGLDDGGQGPSRRSGTMVRSGPSESSRPGSMTTRRSPVGRWRRYCRHHGDARLTFSAFGPSSPGCSAWVWPMNTRRSREFSHAGIPAWGWPEAGRDVFWRNRTRRSSPTVPDLRWPAHAFGLCGSRRCQYWIGGRHDNLQNRRLRILPAIADASGPGAGERRYSPGASCSVEGVARPKATGVRPRPEEAFQHLVQNTPGASGGFSTSGYRPWRKAPAGEAAGQAGVCSGRGRRAERRLRKLGAAQGRSSSGSTYLASSPQLEGGEASAPTTGWRSAPRYPAKWQRSSTVPRARLAIIAGQS